MPIKKNKQDAAVVKELKELSKAVVKSAPSYLADFMKPKKFTDKFAIWEERTTNGVTENRVVRLFIIETCIDEFPESIGELSQLEKLVCVGAFSMNIPPPEIPSSIVNLQNLKTFTLRGWTYNKYPRQSWDNQSQNYNDAFEKLSKLPLLVRLTIKDNSLDKISGTITKLSNLEYVDLSHNELSDIPDSFSKLTKLKKLVLGQNKFDNSTEEKINKLLPNVEIDWRAVVTADMDYTPL